MTILVVGGAGYVGSVVAEELVQHGHRVVVVDNLQQGHRQAVHPDASFIEGDIGHREVLERLFANHDFEAVFHLAGETLVTGSVSNPHNYFRNNLRNGVELLGAMLDHNVRRIVFSSTAAVYGEPEKIPIPEEADLHPITPYGESKLMFERILRSYHQAYDFRVVIFRYFNAAGATARCGEHHMPETHLIPLVLEAADGGQNSVKVLGLDYDTPDGTCIRDYIHVADVAQAHLLALERIDDLGLRTYNLGNGGGHSVLEVVEVARRVTRRPIRIRATPRRTGDPARLVAGSGSVRKELGWEPTYSDLECIIGSAWQWRLSHPDGYVD